MHVLQISDGWAKNAANAFSDIRIMRRLGVWVKAEKEQFECLNLEVLLKVSARLSWSERWSYDQKCRFEPGSGYGALFKILSTGKKG